MGDDIYNYGNYWVLLPIKYINFLTHSVSHWLQVGIDDTAVAQTAWHFRFPQSHKKPQHNGFIKSFSLQQELVAG